jgi:oxygen-independent coproporphyrinogen-3 oxidase
MAEFRHIYVHVPFCDVICHYCHFYTARTAETDQREFFRALGKELRRARGGLSSGLEAIYFGGGTPGASPPDELAKFLELLKTHRTEKTEITIETNPSNVTRERARLWREAGINRVSLGVQSLDDATLRRLGRVHSADEARRAVDAIAGEIDNVTCDLIYAVPEQDEALPAAHALELHRLGAKHLSFYHLTLEKGHFLHSKLPPDDFAWRQLRRVADALEPIGFDHYEIASFALPGRESRNNKNYWFGGPYFALGPSAHGFDGDRTRWTHVSDWREYVRRAEVGECTRAWTETLTDEQRRIEVVFTSLRTREGLDLKAFRKSFGESLAETRAELLGRWREEGLARLDGGRLVLTFEGRMLVDELTKALL